MRLIDSNENIDYGKTKSFFEKRAAGYNSDNPYSVTMYQDSNSNLVKERNDYETKKLLQYLEMDENSRVLDLACGIGRWADAIGDKIEKYVGVDFSEGLISIAKERNNNPKADFYIGTIDNIGDFCESKSFNRLLIIGFLMYLNDDDVMKLFEKIENYLEDNSIICIREPIGINSRLTLKDFYSDELKSEYNAIYRTDSNIKAMMKDTFFKKGFFIEKEGFLFDEIQLNNRRETSQYFYVLKRKK